MLINTLFLSKSVSDSDLRNKSAGSEKLFGFLFSEIINVNDETQKISLVPELVGGNLIDYKSVFINYNFDSNVVLSNQQTKETKDPIISLSELFFNTGNSDSKRLNEAEKIIYSPQQFVSSLSQLVNLLINNENNAANVELKLFSNNFILSQTVVQSQLPNIEKFLLETIEHESNFSLTLSAFDKQILFEVSSQVVPSVITEDRRQYLEGNLDISEYKKIIEDVIAFKSSEKSEVKSSSPLINEIKYSNHQPNNSILDNNNSDNVKNQNLNVLPINNTKDIVSEKPTTVVTDLLNSKPTTEDNSELISKALTANSTEREQNQIKVTTRDDNSIDALKKDNLVNIPNDKLNKSEKVIMKSDDVQENHLTKSETPNIKITESSLSGKENNINKIDNPQIKIIIKDELQTSHSVITQKNLNELNKISEIIQNSNEGKQIEIIAKINSSQTENSKNIIDNNFNNLRNHLAAERQLQNLFRTIVTNNLPSNTENSSIQSNPVEQVASNNIVEGDKNLSNQDITKNNSLTQNINKNDVNPTEIKHNTETDSLFKKEVTETIKPTNINFKNSELPKNNDSEQVLDEASNETILEPKIKKHHENDYNTKEASLHSVKGDSSKNYDSVKRDVKPLIDNQANTDLTKTNNAENKTLNSTIESKLNSEIKDYNLKDLNTSRLTDNSKNLLNENEVSPKIALEEKVTLINNKELLNQKTPLNKHFDNDLIIENKDLKNLKGNNTINNTSTSETQHDPQKENQIEIKSYQNTKAETSKNSDTQSSAIKNSLEVNVKSSEIKIDNKNISKTTSEADSVKENMNTTFGSNSKNQKEILTDSSNPIRVVSERPAKNVVGLNLESAINEKQVRPETAKVNSDYQKEVKIETNKEGFTNQQTLKNEVKSELNNHKDESSRNSSLENKPSPTTENTEHIPDTNIENESINDFRNHLQGIDKKTFQVSSKFNSDTITPNNRTDFSKFIESKSLENFIRAFNNNNLNYRAELNTTVQNNNSVELRLYPEELGRVKISIETLENIVSARIEVQSEQVKNIILSNLPRLRDSLNQEGLNVQNLDVYLGSEEQRNNHNGNQKNKNNSTKMSFDNEEQVEEIKIKNLGYNTIEYLA